MDQQLIDRQLEHVFDAYYELGQVATVFFTRFHLLRQELELYARLVKTVDDRRDTTEMTVTTLKGGADERVPVGVEGHRDAGAAGDHRVLRVQDEQPGAAGLL